MTTSDNSPSLSEDEDDEFADGSRKSSPQDISFEGTLSKWTNYINGWQNRYVILQNGTLSYYKSESDTAYGCRGSVSLGKARVEAHEFDDCRFDVHVNDCVYYLRCKDHEERQKWVSAVEKVKLAESGYGSETHLPKVGSMLSLTSGPSLQSTSSFKRGHGLKEKLMEIETFRDILCRQVDTLQSFFDLCAEKSPDTHSDRLDMNDDDDIETDENGELAATPTPTNAGFMNHANRSARSHSDGMAGTNLPENCGVDFKGEAITFKATTAGILAILSHCVEVMSMRDDQWRKRLEKERDRRKRLEEKYKQAIDNAHKKSFLAGPDYVEGPHSKLNEEEFYDAVETALDREDEEEQHPARTKSELRSPVSSSHRFSEMIEKSVAESLTLIKEPTDVEGTTWELVFEDGEMMVYRKDYEIDGIVCDPLKASHLVEGVSGHEMCHYFFDKDVRLEWETTVEKVRMLEKLSDDSIIFNQIHKRIWPSSQRDTCFLSHLRELTDREVGDFSMENRIGSVWMVNNFSVDHEDAPSTKYLRALATIIMFCQTIVKKGADLNNLTRDDVSCRLTYSAQVNPGGWAPPSVVRTITKREYPKFLRRFSAFVQEITAEKALML